MIVSRIVVISLYFSFLFSAFENQKKLDLINYNIHFYNVLNNKKVFQFNFSYYQPYQLKWLDVSSFSCSFPLLNNIQNISLYTSGDKLYREYNIQLKSGIFVKEYTSIYVHADLYSIFIKNYGSAKCLTGGYSIFLSSSKNLKFLIEMTDIIRSSNNTISGEIAGIMRLHSYFQWKENHIFEIGLIKDPLFPLSQLIKWTNTIGDLNISSGLLTEPMEVLISGGINNRYFKINLNILYNPTLGISTGINLGI